MSAKTIGYARTANSQGDIELQISALIKAGCTEVYTDKAVSGTSMDRIGLSEARAALKSGDTFVVDGIDRLSRNILTYSRFRDDLIRDGILLRLINP